MSKGLCQGEEGRDSLGPVFVSEYGEKDAVHRGSILEDTHGSGALANFAESAFDGIGGADGLSLIRSGITETSEQIVEIVAQAIDGGEVGGFPALSEATGMGAGLGEGWGVHDGVEGSLDGGLIGLFDLVEDIADLVSPTTLDRDVGIRFVKCMNASENPKVVGFISAHSGRVCNTRSDARNIKYSCLLTLQHRC